MRKCFLLLLLFTGVLLARCGKQISPTDPIFDDKVALSKRIRMALRKDYLQELGVSNTDAREIKAFYKKRRYKPLWSKKKGLSPTGKMLEKITSQSQCIGIPTNRWNYKVIAEKELITKELLLTFQLGTAVHDLKSGLLDTVAKAMKPLKWTDKTAFRSLTQHLDTVTDWGNWFAKLGPHHTDYHRIARGLFAYAFDRSFSEKTFVVPSWKEDSVNCLLQTRASLLDKNYLDTENAPDTIVTAALFRFQEDNGLKPDGVIGTYTRQALEESAQTKVDRTVLSLERWRWRAAFPSRYVWINIPEYMLRLYYNDTLFSEHRVVVGKLDTRTPQLESMISSIISYPYWVVPYSISSKEILPGLKQSPDYAGKHRYKIFRKNEEIDPYTVNWKGISEKAFGYKVRQDPGTHNSLGVIKFEFANKFGVYVHDTPAKSLFRTDVRSYSHGCIRCNLPDSLARFILRRDHQVMLPDSLDSLLVRQEHRSIRLRHPVAIQVDYITVTANAAGKLTIHPDIYGKDAVYLKWFNQD